MRVSRRRLSRRATRGDWLRMLRTTLRTVSALSPSTSPTSSTTSRPRPHATSLMVLPSSPAGAAVVGLLPLPMAVRRAGRRPRPSRQRSHPATVGHVSFMAFDPTTSAKWPPRTAASYTSARGAASRMARTPGGRAMSSVSPMNASTGQVMSASVSVRPSMTKPPENRRLCTRTWSMKSRSAGPGHATQPSPARNRRCPSRRCSVSRSCRPVRNSSWLRTSLVGLISLNTVRLNHAGTAERAKERDSTGPSVSSSVPATSAGRPAIGSRRTSTGLPKVTSDASPSDSR